MSYVRYGDVKQLLSSELGDRGSKVFCITDREVYRLYRSLFDGCDEVVVIDGGEASKSMEEVVRLQGRMLECGVQRGDVVVGVGGGVVTDIAGFVAATYHRGIRVGFVPTTLLAQVDAAIGGKNGVNLRGYKNIVGTFYAPEFVIIDTKFLGTLPPRELRCGYGEVVKYLLLMGRGMIDGFVSDEQMVRRCVEIKMDIVERDFRESGERRLLNLGHTFGHAIEKCCCIDGGIAHGEAVAMGCYIAARLSVALGIMPAGELHRVRELIESFSLSYRLPDTVDKASLIEAVAYDKKRDGGSIDMVLLRGVGDPLIRSVALRDLHHAYNSNG